MLIATQTVRLHPLGASSLETYFLTLLLAEQGATTTSGSTRATMLRSLTENKEARW